MKYNTDLVSVFEGFWPSYTRTVDTNIAWYNVLQKLPVFDIVLFIFLNYFLICIIIVEELKAAFKRCDADFSTVPLRFLSVLQALLTTVLNLGICMREQTHTRLTTRRMMSADDAKCSRINE